MIRGVIVVVILVWLLYWYRSAQKCHEDYLYGCWTVDSGAFCEDADIDSMMLFIGESDGYERNAYLVISPDVCNQGLTLRLSGGWNPCCDEYSWSSSAEFDDSPIWPEQLKFVVNRADGTLRIFGEDDVLYASLCKQHDITNAARLAV